MMLKRIVKKAVLVVVAIGTVVAALEIIGRLLPMERLPGILPVVVQAMRLHGNTFYREDDYFRYITAANVDLRVQHPEFTYHIRTKLNFGEAGFRGGSKGDPIWAVAIGDSFTFGMGVEQTSAWVARLADLGRREIINLGVPGWGPHQYTRAVERYGALLKPRVILYGIYRNDLQDVILFDQWLHQPKYKRSVDYFLRANSITFNLFRSQWMDLIPETQNLYVGDSGIQFNLPLLQTSLAKERKNFPLSWSLMKPQIELAMNISRKAGADFVLLYLPSKLETYWELVKDRDPSLQSFQDSVEMFRTHLADLSKAERILYLDLTSALRTQASRTTQLYFPSDSHWTENGNRIVAAEIHKFALANGLYQ